MQFILSVGKHRKFLKSGDVALVVTGWRPGSGYTNTVRVVLVPWTSSMDNSSFSFPRSRKKTETQKWGSSFKRLLPLTNDNSVISVQFISAIYHLNPATRDWAENPLSETFLTRLCQQMQVEIMSYPFIQSSVHALKLSSPVGIKCYCGLAWLFHPLKGILG